MEVADTAAQQASLTLAAARLTDALGDTAAASALCDDALTLQPGSAAALRARLRLAERQGDAAAARETLGLLAGALDGDEGAHYRAVHGEWTLAQEQEGAGKLDADDLDVFGDGLSRALVEAEAALRQGGARQAAAILEAAAGPLGERVGAALAGLAARLAELDGDVAAAARQRSLAARLAATARERLLVTVGQLRDAARIAPEAAGPLLDELLATLPPGNFKVGCARWAAGLARHAADTERAARLLSDPANGATSPSSLRDRLDLERRGGGDGVVEPERTARLRALLAEAGDLWQTRAGRASLDLMGAELELHELTPGSNADGDVTAGAPPQRDAAARRALAIAVAGLEAAPGLVPLALVAEEVARRTVDPGLRLEALRLWARFDPARAAYAQSLVVDTLVAVHTGDAAARDEAVRQALGELVAAAPMATAFWTLSARERAAGRRSQAADALARGAAAWGASEIAAPLQRLADALRADAPARWPAPVPGRGRPRVAEMPESVLGEAPADPAALALITLSEGVDAGRLAAIYSNAATAAGGASERLWRLQATHWLSRAGRDADALAGALALREADRSWEPGRTIAERLVRVLADPAARSRALVKLGFDPQDAGAALRVAEASEDLGDAAGASVVFERLTSGPLAADGARGLVRLEGPTEADVRGYDRRRRSRRPPPRRAARAGEGVRRGGARRAQRRAGGATGARAAPSRRRDRARPLPRGAVARVVGRRGGGRRQRAAAHRGARLARGAAAGQSARACCAPGARPPRPVARRSRRARTLRRQPAGRGASRWPHSPTSCCGATTPTATSMPTARPPPSRAWATRVRAPRCCCGRRSGISAAGDAPRAEARLRAALERDRSSLPALRALRRALVARAALNEAAALCEREAEVLQTRDERVRVLLLAAELARGARAGVAAPAPATPPLPGAAARPVDAAVIGPLRKILAIDPSHVGAFEQLREALTAAADHAALGELLAARIAVATNPFEVAALRLARAGLLSGPLADLEGSKVELRAVLAKEPQHGKALSRLADLQYDSGAFGEAAELYLRRAQAERSPERLREIFLRIGRIYARHERDAKRAADAYKRVLQLEGDNREALVALADLLVEIGETKNAIAVTDRLVEQTPEADKRVPYLIRLGQLWEQAGDLRQAGARFRRAADEAPRNLLAVGEMVRHCERTRDLPGRRALLDHALLLLRADLHAGKLDVEVLRALVHVMQWRGRAAAAAAGAQLLATASTDPADRAAASGWAAPPARGRRLALLARPDVDERLFPAGLPSGVRNIFRIIGEPLAKAVSDLKRYELSRGDRVARGQGAREIIDAVAAELGVKETDVYVKPARAAAEPAWLAVEPGEPPTLILGASILTLGPHAVRFAAARLLRLASTHLDLVLRDTPPKTGALVGGVVRQFVTDYRHPDVPAEVMNAGAASVARALSRRLRQEVMPFAIESAGALDLGALHEAVRDGANQVGLLASGDFPAGLAVVLAIAGRPLTLAQVAANPEALALLDFALSDGYEELVRELEGTAPA